MTVDVTVCCYSGGSSLTNSLSFHAGMDGPIEISHSRCYMNDNSNAVIPFRMDNRAN